MSSLFNQLNPLSQRLPNNIKQMIQNFKMVSNPQSMVKQMMDKNPQLKAVLEASNGNAEQAFRNMAKEMNVDPDEIIKMLS